MRSEEQNAKGSANEKGHSQSKKKRHSSDHWVLENTRDWVEMFLVKRMSVMAIAEEIGEEQSTVSRLLKAHGVEIHKGMRRKERDPPKISVELSDLLRKGSDEVLKLLNDRVWGIGVSDFGLKQLNKFCDFVRLPLTVGLTAAASALETDKSMITAWTSTTKQPYLVRVADTVLRTSTRPGWKLLPLWLESGGNAQGPWIQVPTVIQTFDDIVNVISQTSPIPATYERAARFGIGKERSETMRPDMLSYALGMMVGDSGKLGGEQERFTSMNLSLFFTKKHPENEKLGELTCMCINSLGIEMRRIKDGDPSGATRQAKNPTGAYRWNSDRSPLIAWIFYVGMGLKTGEKTSNDPVHMDWLFNMPFEFRKRFVQGLADSDGCARKYVVEICSVPNAEFTTKLLHSLGMKSAHTRKEKLKDLRSVVRVDEAATLPIFNEFTNGYRYEKLIRSGRK